MPPRGRSWRGISAALENREAESNTGLRFATGDQLKHFQLASAQLTVRRISWCCPRSRSRTRAPLVDGPEAPGELVTEIGFRVPAWNLAQEIEASAPVAGVLGARADDPGMGYARASACNAVGPEGSSRKCG